MDYSYLDNNINILPPVGDKNAGLYTGDVNFTKQPWGNDYRHEHIPADAGAFASQFYAKSHIPSYQNRPGNNTINSDLVKPSGNPYNIYCHL